MPCSVSESRVPQPVSHCHCLSPDKQPLPLFLSYHHVLDSDNNHADRGAVLCAVVAPTVPSSVIEPQSGSQRQFQRHAYTASADAQAQATSSIHCQLQRGPRIRPSCRQITRGHRHRRYTAAIYSVSCHDAQPPLFGVLPASGIFRPCQDSGSSRC